MKISSSDAITLVTLQGCPAALTFSADVFSRIAKLGANVDMISQAPIHGDTISISFPIADDDLGKILSFLTELRENYKVKPIISSGNCKINVYDENMKDTPGVAAKVFTAAAAVETDIRIITTSDVDISILVTEADFHATLKAIEAAAK